MREMEMFSNLRAANESKLLPTADCMDLKVCFCQKAPMGAMLQCELCRDAFHSVCVREPSDSCDSQPWLCPHCLRSERPPLSQVLSLLTSLQSINVRLPEGDALSYLVERTLHWQHRAQQLSQACNLPELEDRPGTPPTLTHWVSGCNNTHNNSQVAVCPLFTLLISHCRCNVWCFHTGSMFDTRVEQDEPRSDGLLHRAEVHPPAGSVPESHPQRGREMHCLNTTPAFTFSANRPELRAGGADGGGTPAAGLSATGPKSLPHLTGPNQQPEHCKQIHVATAGGGTRL